MTNAPPISPTKSVLEGDGEPPKTREVIVKQINKTDLLAGLRERIADIRALFRGYTKAANSKVVVYLKEEPLNK